MKTLFYAIILASTTYCEAYELPEAPSGFHWERGSSINVALLRPEGWFTKEEQRSDGATAIFITKELIAKNQLFKTGLTFNCVRNIPVKTGVAPSVYIIAFAQKTASAHKLDEESQFGEGPFKGIRLRYVDAPRGRPSITICHLLIANDQTGTMFSVMFEAPTKNWESEWKLGFAIFKNLKFGADL